MTAPAARPTPPTRLSVPRPRWVARAEEAEGAEAAAALAQVLSLPLPLCRLLVQRGHRTDPDARRFLRPRLDQLLDPLLLADVGPAAARLSRALDAGETILVHGDYDVDGICAASLYTRVLRRLGAKVETFVPHRVADGYDLGEGGVRRAVEVGAGLILTGDCGILAHDAVEAAGAAGIDVIVTDHHTPGATLPAAVAVVDPKRADSGYPEAVLAGTGVAFKVCQALARARGLEETWLWYQLDLVALATIADLVPLRGENRVLARVGLRVLRETRNPGLAAMLREAGLAELEELAAGQVSHVLAPRLNAVGRIDDAAIGARLLLSEDEAEAAALAARLGELNRERQTLDRATLDEALALLARDFDPEADRVVVLAGEGWHPGVIGIVASRVVERIHRPAVLIALNGAAPRARGSARSIPGFHLYEALAACAPHLQRFGGHAAAAGLDIEPARIAAFREALNAHARVVLPPEALVPELAIDLEVRLAEATSELCRYLRHLGPFGVGNPTPVFAARGVAMHGPARIVGKDHLKLELLQDGVRLAAIGFRMAERADELAGGRARLDVAFQLVEDRWKGRSRLQARLVDLRRVE